MTKNEVHAAIHRLANRRMCAPRPRRRAATLLTLVLWSACFTSLAPVIAPAAPPGSRWARHTEASQTVLDHGIWQELLQRYVRPAADGINRFAYGDVDTADRQRLDAYLAELAATPVSTLSRREQRAYWVNLYNALTVRVILDHYPVASIRDIDLSPGLFSAGPWDARLVTVEGVPLSLNDIEHRILRPIWGDPRLHYAVNCASLGCPNLQNEAFTAANSERLLDQGAVAYVNAPRGAQVEAGQLRVSSIYVWFEEDFGGGDRGVIEHLKRYARPDLHARLNEIHSIAGHQYDWRLNDAEPAPPH
jgi:Protein of unknown function, DUF547.